MNNCTFTGNLGRDAETRYTPSGTAVASFPLAVKAGYGDNEKTVWVRCSLFGKRAEGGLIQYLTKGQQVCVSGELSVSEWDKQDGSKGHAVELRIAELDLIGGKRDGQAQQPAATPQQPEPSASQAIQQPPLPGGASLDDDIPFMRLPDGYVL